MNAQLKADLENARQCLLETYHLAMTYGTPDTKDPEKYFDLAAKLSQIDEQYKRKEASLESAKESSRTMDEFVNEYKQQIQSREQKKYNPKNTSDFKHFREQILQMQSLQDDSGASGSRVECDEFVMESEINVYDPLTKQRMRNPVRNAICKHHYEKSSILEAISLNKRLRCPVAGCGNKEFVKQQHLMDDNLFKMRLQKLAEQESEENE